MTVVPMLRNPALGQNSNWTLLLLADEGNRAEDKEKEQSFCSSDSATKCLFLFGPVRLFYSALKGVFSTNYRSKYRVNMLLVC